MRSKSIYSEHFIKEEEAFWNTLYDVGERILCRKKVPKFSSVEFDLPQNDFWKPYSEQNYQKSFSFSLKKLNRITKKSPQNQTLSAVLLTLLAYLMTKLHCIPTKEEIAHCQWMDFSLNQLINNPSDCAMSLYRTAVERGSLFAMLHIACAIRSSHYTPTAKDFKACGIKYHTIKPTGESRHNIQYSAFFYRKAAELGSSTAIERLARLIQVCDYVPTNEDLKSCGVTDYKLKETNFLFMSHETAVSCAAAFYRTAARKGNTDAIKNLGNLVRYCNYDPQLNDLKSCWRSDNRVGVRLRTDRNSITAFFYRQAIKRGDPQAIVLLTRIIEKSNYVPESLDFLSCGIKNYPTFLSADSVPLFYLAAMRLGSIEAINHLGHYVEKKHEIQELDSYIKKEIKLLKLPNRNIYTSLFENKLDLEKIFLFGRDKSASLFRIAAQCGNAAAVMGIIKLILSGYSPCPQDLKACGVNHFPIEQLESHLSGCIVTLLHSAIKRGSTEAIRYLGRMIEKGQHLPTITDLKTCGIKNFPPSLTEHTLKVSSLLYMRLIQEGEIKGVRYLSNLIRSSPNVITVYDLFNLIKQSRCYQRRAAAVFLRDIITRRIILKDFSVARLFFLLFKDIVIRIFSELDYQEIQLMTRHECLTLLNIHPCLYNLFLQSETKIIKFIEKVDLQNYTSPPLFNLAKENPSFIPIAANSIKLRKYITKNKEEFKLWYPIYPEGFKYSLLSYLKKNYEYPNEYVDLVLTFPDLLGVFLELELRYNLEEKKLLSMMEGRVESFFLISFFLYNRPYHFQNEVGKVMSNPDILKIVFSYLCLSSFSGFNSPLFKKLYTEYQEAQDILKVINQNEKIYKQVKNRNIKNRNTGRGKKRSISTKKNWYGRLISNRIPGEPNAFLLQWKGKALWYQIINQDKQLVIKERNIDSDELKDVFLQEKISKKDLKQNLAALLSLVLKENNYHKDLITKTMMTIIYGSAHFKEETTKKKILQDLSKKYLSCPQKMAKFLSLNF